MARTITIDPNSGFCYGVIRAIDKAEEALCAERELFSLGSIVHNNVELGRLEKKGLKVIDLEEFKKLHGAKVLIRAHGEPPTTYQIAQNNNIQLLECTCPVVLKLQQRIKDEYARIEHLNGQIIIFGKNGHAEVNGLIGQVGGNAIIIEKDIPEDKIDFKRPISLFSQTTQDPEQYETLVREIKGKIVERGGNIESLNVFYTICNQVASRRPLIRQFAESHNVILFVCGKTSSNGKILFSICKEANKESYCIEQPDEIKKEWFPENCTIGICGATSTPKWLMEAVAQTIEDLQK